MRILYTTARFPYPPLRGDQLVPYFRIRHLAKRHEITLLSFVQAPDELAYVNELRQYCVDVHTVQLPRWCSYAGMARSVFTSLPFQVSYYSSAVYRRKLTDLVKDRKFDVIHTVLSRPANHTIGITGSIKICEMIDALSLTVRRRAATSTWPARWLWTTEADRMRRFERRVCKAFDGVVVVSEVDYKELDSPNVTVIPLGTDVSPKLRPSSNGHRTIIFTGNFEYYPNPDAAQFLICEIWPELRRVASGLRLKLVGNNPGPKVLRLARQFPDVEVTGFVPDLRQHLAEADVAIAPMRLAGGGTHCKALEAMACGTPVIVSPLVTGIRGKPGRDFLVAANVSEYVEAVCGVLQNPTLAKTLSENGRRLVMQHYSWESTTQQLESLYQKLLQDRRYTSLAHRN
jgi:polysaccharide biosynthesis protein PslH